MIIFPAIDIRNGRCVRLQQGRFDKEDIYDENPIEVAQRWEKKGAQYLHMVDLDGALYGQRVNGKVVEAIVQSITIPVQLGGGIRTIEDIEKVLALGIHRVILGTAAVEEKSFLEKALRNYGEKIAVSIDAHEGYVAVEGWTKTSAFKAMDFAKQLADMGLKTLIYTDIAKDGMLSGPNFEELKNLKKNVDLNIIASGGISSKQNIEKLRELQLYGAIIGKALYTGNIKLEEL
jgi:phosphoribosylformimino-5-aminoimidazole carboxamide ribotide isomerase